MARTVGGTDRRPRSPDRAAAFDAVGVTARCAAACVRLVARGQLHQPRTKVGIVVAFADGSSARIYRETVVHDAPLDDPCVLAVRFRLRVVRREALHRLFRSESELNTVLFAGYPGFVSKLWLMHDEHGRYRGIYQWDGADRARAYVRSLWWSLAAVSVLDSIEHVVIDGAQRDAWLDAAGTPAGEWWRPVGQA
jgi:hypothetical protein